MKIALANFVARWARLVVWTRLALTAVFLPMMVFGFFAFQEARLVAFAAVVILSFVAVRDVRSLRSLSAIGRLEDRAGSSEPGVRHGSGGVDSFAEMLSDLAKLRTIHASVIGTQIAGAAIAWWAIPAHGFLSLLGGGAAASVIGLVVGIWLDSIGANAWAASHSMVQKTYSGCAVGIAILGVFLLVALDAGLKGVIP